MDRGNKKDRGRVHELSAPISFTHMEPNVPPHTHCEAVGSKVSKRLAQEMHVVRGGESIWVLTGVGSFRHLSAINNNSYYWHEESHHG